MKKIWEILKEVFNGMKIILNWIWITFMIIIVILYIAVFDVDLLYLKYVGSAILIALTIRRILIFFNVFEKTINRFRILEFFLIGLTLPILGQYISQYSSFNSDLKSALVAYCLLFASLNFTLAKSGAFRVKSQKRAKKSVEKMINHQQEIRSRSVDKKEKQKIKEKTKAPQPEDRKNQTETTIKENKRYYCKYCGQDYHSIRGLSINKCEKGNNKGKPHVYYEGGEKDEYYCKFCGWHTSNIKTLTANKCQLGSNKGRYHEPAL